MLLAILQALPAAVGAAQRAVPVVSSTCDADVQSYLARLPAARAAETQVIGLLNAKRYREAIPALRAAVTRYADPWAGYTLGHLYAQGLGASRDPKTAAHWYLWSAERGGQFAQQELADAYLNGVGVERDTARAAYWFRIGVAPSELAGSDRSLAETYASGTLAPVNRAKQKYYLDQSLRTLNELAREPNAAANFELGKAYVDGSGVTRNPKKALAYLCRALVLGYGPAVPLIRKLEEADR